MTLYPSKGIMERTMLAIRHITQGHDWIKPLLDQFDGSMSMWDRTPADQRLAMYKVLVQRLGPFARDVYFGRGVDHHSAEQMWTATLLRFRSLYDRDLNPSLPTAEILELVESWDPRKRGKSLSQEDAQLLRDVAGMVHAMKEARQELPSINALKLLAQVLGLKSAPSSTAAHSATLAPGPYTS
ncbi:hypothetical protein JCM11251_000086 [Rhodosporidiobolus azoricus]